MELGIVAVEGGEDALRHEHVGVALTRRDHQGGWELGDGGFGGQKIRKGCVISPDDGGMGLVVGNAGHRKIVFLLEGGNSPCGGSAENAVRDQRGQVRIQKRQGSDVYKRQKYCREEKRATHCYN